MDTPHGQIVSSLRKKDEVFPSQSIKTLSENDHPGAGYTHEHEEHPKSLVYKECRAAGWEGGVYMDILRGLPRELFKNSQISFIFPLGVK